MDALEMEAMLVRHEAAMGLAKHGKVDGLTLLASVVAPSEDVLRASVSVATAKGPRLMARTLAEKSERATRPRKRRLRKPRTRALSVSLDELLASV